MPARNIKLKVQWGNEYFRLSFVTEFKRNAMNFYGQSVLEEHSGSSIAPVWIPHGISILDFIRNNNITTIHSTVGGFQLGNPSLNQAETSWMWNSWSTGDGNQQFILFNDLMPAEDLTIYSNWTRRNNLQGAARITVDTNEGHLSGDSLVEQVMWYYHNLLHLIHRARPREITRSGYIFAGWYVIEFGIVVRKDNENRYFRMPAQHITIIAQWEEDLNATFTIYFDTGDANVLITEVSNVLVGTSILDAIANVNVPARLGYRFLGWLLEDEELSGQIMPREDVILVAIWEENYVRVNIHINTNLDLHGVIVFYSYVRHGTSISEAFAIFEERYVNRYLDIMTHRFQYFFIITEHIKLQYGYYIIGEIYVMTEFYRHSARLTFDPTMSDIEIDEIILPVGIYLLPMLEYLGIATLENINGWSFSHWYYVNGAITGIVGPYKLVPSADPLLQAIFTYTGSDDFKIVIYADYAIFNDQTGEGNRTFFIINDLYAQIDIRQLLLELRDAMNGLHGNVNREFRGINFSSTPGLELIGFYKLDEREINVLHTQELLSFNDGNILIFYAMVRNYTFRSNLFFGLLDDGTYQLLGRDNTITTNWGLTVLPSFHRGRKVTKINGTGLPGGQGRTNHFRSLNITYLYLPVYITAIQGANVFGSNNFTRLCLRGLPNLTYISSQTFIDAGWRPQTWARIVSIDRITPLLTFTNAFLRTEIHRVNMYGNWIPSEIPTWWENRVNFYRSFNNFFNQAGVNMIDFFG